MSKTQLRPTLGDIVRLRNTKAKSGENASGTVRFVGLRKGRLTFGVELRKKFAEELGETSGKIGGFQYFKCTNTAVKKAGVFVSGEEEFEMVRASADSVRYRLDDRVYFAEWLCKGTVKAVTRGKRVIYGVLLSEPLSDTDAANCDECSDGWFEFKTRSETKRQRLFWSAKKCGLFLHSSQVRPPPNEELSARSATFILEYWTRNFGLLFPTDLAPLIAGEYTGKLANEGERLQIGRPAGVAQPAGARPPPCRAPWPG